jgi:hypothetical protein
MTSTRSASVSNHLPAKQHCVWGHVR